MNEKRMLAEKQEGGFKRQLSFLKESLTIAEKRLFSLRGANEICQQELIRTTYQNRRLSNSMKAKAEEISDYKRHLEFYKTALNDKQTAYFNLQDEMQCFIQRNNVQELSILDLKSKLRILEEKCQDNQHYIAFLKSSTCAKNYHINELNRKIDQMQLDIGNKEQEIFEMSLKLKLERSVSEDDMKQSLHDGLQDACAQSSIISKHIDKLTPNEEVKVSTPESIFQNTPYAFFEDLSEKLPEQEESGTEEHSSIDEGVEASAENLTTEADCSTLINNQSKVDYENCEDQNLMFTNERKDKLFRELCIPKKFSNTFAESLNSEGYALGLKDIDPEIWRLFGDHTNDTKDENLEFERKEGPTIEILDTFTEHKGQTCCPIPRPKFLSEIKSTYLEKQKKKLCNGCGQSGKDYEDFLSTKDSGDENKIYDEFPKRTDRIISSPEMGDTRVSQINVSDQTVPNEKENDEIPPETLDKCKTKKRQNFYSLATMNICTSKK